MQTSVTKEQLMEIIAATIHTKTLGNFYTNEIVDGITVDLADLEKYYEEKYEETLPKNVSPEINFRHFHFNNCTFTNLNFTNCSFINCQIYNCTFKSCNLCNTYFVHLWMSATNIVDCVLTRAKFCYSELDTSTISKSQLKDTRFAHASIQAILFDEVNFLRSGFYYTDLSHNIFNKCYKMKQLVIKYSHISASRFKDVKLDKTSSIERLHIDNSDPKNPPFDEHFISVQNIGSRLDTTYYDYENDRVICGCWNGESNKYNECIGGTLKEFTDRVNHVYSDGRFHKEYMNAIELFRFAREKYLKSI